MELVAISIFSQPKENMKNTEKINWGIIGFGQIARDRIAPALTQLEGARLAAVFDVSRDARERAAVQYGCVAYERLGDMLTDENVHVVYIATPNALHCEQTVAAAEKGKHVLCEKPMALTTDQCSSMIDACAAAGVKLGIGCMGRFNAFNVQARSLAASGALGTILHARGWFSFVNSERGGWRYNASMSGGGPVMDLGIHLINLIRFVLGAQVEHVWATGEYRGYKIEQTTAALFRLAGGATCELGCSYETEMYASLELLGDQGKLAMDSTLFQSASGTLRLSVGGECRALNVSPVDPYMAEIAEMTNAVRGRGHISTDGKEGWYDIAIAQAWLASIRTGQKVIPSGYSNS
jgi:predicted dehydrogenase